MLTVHEADDAGCVREIMLVMSERLQVVTSTWHAERKRIPATEQHWKSQLKALESISDTRNNMDPALLHMYSRTASRSLRFGHCNNRQMNRELTHTKNYQKCSQGLSGVIISWISKNLTTWSNNECKVAWWFFLRQTLTPTHKSEAPRLCWKIEFCSNEENYDQKRHKNNK